MNEESVQIIHPSRKIHQLIVYSNTNAALRSIQRISRGLYDFRTSQCIKNSKLLKKDPWLDRAPSSSGQSVAPAHSVARRALVGQRDDLRCLRYPAARAPVGVSSSRRAVCARCCGRTLHGPKVRPKNQACMRERAQRLWWAACI